MLSDKNLEPNVFENLQATKGENIIGVLTIENMYVFVFQSGYSLSISARFKNLAITQFWVNERAKTKELISKELAKREKWVHNLENYIGEVKQLQESFSCAITGEVER